jgi:putative flippase GtrA
MTAPRPTQASPSGLGRLARYLAVGAVSFAVDEGMLVGLANGAHVRVPVAATVAFLTGLMVNFTGQRTFTFPHGQRGAAVHIARYLVIVAINLVVTVGVVTALAAVGVPAWAGKAMVVAALAGFNLWVYRRWVYV